MNDYLVNEGIGADARGLILMQHAEGSLRQYQNAWRMFLDFLKWNRIHRSSVKLATVLNFLADEALRKKAYRTVATYKCVLKLPLGMRYSIDIDHPLTMSFMRGHYGLA